MKEFRKFYIDGEWVDPLASQSFDVVNPATEEVFARIGLGGVEDVDRAVRAARAAFLSFSQTSKAERIALLKRIVDAMAAREEELVAAVMDELGTPINVRIHVDAGIASFKQAIVTLTDYEFEIHLGPNIVRREAIGVCGMITAWNWPVQLLCTKLSAALAAGCCVVAKPSEFTSITAIVLTQALHDAGVPKGVFNLVLGDGPTVGSAISSHPNIDMVSFTGSTRAGVLVAQAAAPSVKRVCQELGGKSANIILPDADLGAAMRWNVTRGVSNSGQSCHAPSRVLVQRSQVVEALEHALAEVENIRIGDPRDPVTTMGPVINRAQFDRIQGYIRRGLEEGARLVCGGPGRPTGFDHGFFIRPTIFADVAPDMTIAPG